MVGAGETVGIRNVGDEGTGVLVCGAGDAVKVGRISVGRMKVGDTVVVWAASIVGDDASVGKGV